MIGRVKRFRERIGLWKAVRAIGVSVLLWLLCLFMAVRHGRSFPLAGCLVGSLTPWLTRDALIERLPSTAKALRFGGPALVVGVLFASILRRKISLPEPAVEIGFAVIMMVVHLYLGALFWVLSDRRVVFEA